MILTTADKLFLIIGLVDMAGLFTAIGYMLYMANSKMAILLHHFRNSAGVINLSALRHGGPWGKLMIIGGISGYVTFPGFYIKRGSLNTEDLRNLPGALKRKLVILQWSSIALLLLMFCLAIVVELEIV